VIVSAFITGHAFGKERLITGGGNIKNDAKSDKTDYHIEITSDTNIRFTGVGPDGKMLGAFLSLPGMPNLPPTRITGDNSFDVTVEWDVSIPINQSGSVIYRAVEEEKNKYWGRSFFTPAHSSTDQPILGWDVTLGGDIFLLNSYTSPVHFEDLRFQRPSELTFEYMSTLINGPPSGFPGLVSSGDVPAGTSLVPGSLFVGNFSLNPGDYLSARMATSFVDVTFSDSSGSVTTALGHESGIPEPSTLELFGTGTLALLGHSWYRRRRVTSRNRHSS